MTWLHRCNHPYAYAGQYLAGFRQHGKNGFIFSLFRDCTVLLAARFLHHSGEFTPTYPETRLFTVMC